MPVSEAFEPLKILFSPDPVFLVPSIAGLSRLLVDIDGYDPESLGAMTSHE